MRKSVNRRKFVKTLLAGTAGLSLMPPPVCAASQQAFAFPLLGDLHYDRLSCHDLERLEREKPDDLRQVREYSSLTTDRVPRLFASVRETIADLPGYAVVKVHGPRVTAIVYSGVGRKPWRTLALSNLLES